MIIAWRSYAQDHQEEKLIGSVILATTPRKTGDNIYLVEVANKGLLSECGDRQLALSEYLRNKLQNDRVTLQFAVSAADSSARMQPKDIANKIRERNPDFKDFVETFGLIIS